VIGTGRLFELTGKADVRPFRKPALGFAQATAESLAGPIVVSLSGFDDTHAASRHAAPRMVFPQECVARGGCRTGG
jgi:hypothetical protein